MLWMISCYLLTLAHSDISINEGAGRRNSGECSQQLGHLCSHIQPIQIILKIIKSSEDVIKQQYTSTLRKSIAVYLCLTRVSFFISTAFHKHLIPVAVSPKAHRAEPRGQAEPRSGPPELQQHLSQHLSQRPRSAWPWGAELRAGRAEEPDEGAADVRGAAQGPANVMRLDAHENSVWICCCEEEIGVNVSL